MHIKPRKELFDQSIELEEAELEAGHVGRVVRTKVVGLHEAHEDAKSFFVGHLLPGLEEGGGAREGSAR